MTKFVYVLTSNSEDCYYEQFLLSLTSLRMKMPDAHVALLTDNKTGKTLTGKRTAFRTMINEFISVEFTEDKDMHYRSRFLKTTIRKHISGDFLYIDCDTIIAKELSEIEKQNITLGAVLDFHNLARLNPPFWGQKAMDKHLSFCSVEKTNTHYNGGLIYSKDNNISHQFFDKWHELWLYSVSKGITVDQPSLNQANYLMGSVINELSGIWNCQTNATGGLPYLHNAKIIHYMISNTTIDYPFLLSHPSIFQQIKQCGEVPKEIKEMLDNPLKQFDKTSLILLRRTYDIMCENDVRTMGLSKALPILIRRVILRLTGKNKEIYS